ncbi:MAG: APC family permease [Planctomycetes bacterium]|nr:APC family permease [Planctomycetota bacterium]MCB9884807.1 APC family permease [Planctomycetota bacterium]
MNDTPRTLSAFDIGCIVVGGIVGVGIFFTPQRVAAAVDGPGVVVLAWSLGGVLAALGAFVFAGLSLRVPGHGGVFRYLEAAFGRGVAFVFGWANWLCIQAGAAGVVALLLVDYLQVAVEPEAPWSESGKVVGAAVLLLVFTFVNVLGLRVGKTVQNVLTTGKIAALAGLVLVAVWRHGDAGEAAAVAAEPTGRPLFGQLGAAMLPVLFAIGGWQQGSFVAGAARRQRSVALGMLGGVAVVIVVYLAVNLAYLDLLGFDGARSSPAIGAAAAKVALGQSGARVLAALVVISAAGILNTICLAPPYVLYAMAERGCFPAVFGRLHPRWGTPVAGILGQGLWATFLLLSVHGLASWAGSAQTIDTLGFVCDGVVFVDWLFYGLCGLALLQLRRGADGGRRGGGLLAALFALGALAVMVGAIAAQPLPSLAGSALVLVGVGVYRIWWRPHAV